MKKFLCILMTLSMLLSYMPMPAAAQNMETDPAETTVETTVETTQAAETTVETTQAAETTVETTQAAETTVETTEAAVESPAAAKVTFVCQPKELTLEVYRVNGQEKTLTAAESDGSYLLAPGSYCYTAACEGYVTADEKPFQVEQGLEQLEIPVTLAEAEKISQEAVPQVLGAASLPEKDDQGRIIIRKWEWTDGSNDKSYFYTQYKEDPTLEFLGKYILNNSIKINGQYLDVADEYTSSDFAVGKTGTFQFAVLPSDVYVLGEGVAPLTASLTITKDSNYKLKSGEVPVAPDTFPDPGIRQVVADTIDTSHDGVLSPEEQENATMFSLNTENPEHAKVSSLQGMEIFTNLSFLFLSDASLTELDASIFPKLGWLYVQNNQLTSLNVSGCPLLEELNCFNNNLTELDISNNADLTGLSCSNNQIKALDVHNQQELCYLYADNNQLTHINIYPDAAAAMTPEDFTADGNVRTFYTQSQGLDLRTLPGFDLTKAASWENGKVTDGVLIPNAFGQPVTYRYDCGNSQWKTFTIVLEQGEESNGEIGGNSNGGNMQDKIVIDSWQWANGMGSIAYLLDTYNGELLTGEYPSFENLCSDLTVDIEYNGGEVLCIDRWTCDDFVQGKAGVYAFEGQLPEGYVLGPDAEALEFYYIVEITDHPLQEGDVILRETDYPDYTLYCKLWDLDRDHNFVLSAEELNGELNLTGEETVYNQITDLTGLEKFKNIRVLRLDNNHMTSADLSIFPDLEELYINRNQLTSLDTSACPKLRILECRNNNLTSLNISGNTALQKIDCSNNSLSNLTVPQGSDLHQLTANNNALQSLDVSGAEGLQVLDAAGNVLRKLDLSRNLQINQVNTADNKWIAYAEKDQINVSELGLDPAGVDQVKDADGRDVRLINGVLYVDPASQTILYNYDCGGKILPFEMTVMRKPAANVKITGKTFPDPVFRDYVKANFDLDHNGTLSADECSKVHSIAMGDVAIFESCEIGSLKGIEYFPGLRSLSICSWSLTEVDLSQNPMLTELELYGYAMSGVDVSSLKDLKVLNMSYSALSTLDVSMLPKLQTLICTNTPMVELDVSQNRELTYLDCSMNTLGRLVLGNHPKLTTLKCGKSDLSALDLSGVPNLLELDCSGNRLQTLDLSSCPMLESLDCSYNQLPDLDLSKLTALQKLICDDNQLRTLALAGLTGLAELQCRNNQLTALEIPNRNIHVLDCANNDLQTLDLNGCGQLDKLICDGNQLLFLNAEGVSYDTRLSCSNNIYFVSGANLDLNQFPELDQSRIFPMEELNQIKYLVGGHISADGILTPDVPNGEVILSYQISPQIEYGCDFTIRFTDAGTSEVTLTEDNFPDQEFRRYLTRYDLNNDGKLSNQERYSVQSISINLFSDTYKISSLKGIEYFPNLRELIAQNLTLTDIDLCQNTELEQLSLINCGLTEIDVSGNQKLIILELNGNPLEKLDLQNNANLATLSLFDTRISSLDLSCTPDLMNLNCDRSNLACLNLDYQNQLSACEAFDNIYTRISDDKHLDLSTIPGFDCSRASNWKGGTVSADGILTVKSLNQPVTYDYLIWPAIDMASEFTIILQSSHNPDHVINKTNFPDKYFQTYIKANVDTNSDGYLDDQEIAAVKSIDVTGKKISSLEGVEIFTELERLACAGNKIQILDVSELKKLQFLDCDFNRLQFLWVYDCDSLKELHCAENQLEELYVHNNKMLEILDCSDNNLTSLILGRNSKLTTLSCNRNQLKKLDLSPLENLTYVSCANNMLEHLQFSKGVQALVCIDNQLSGLNLPENSALKNLLCDNNNLGELTLDRTPLLEELHCSNCGLVQLDLTQVPKMQDLDCSNNRIETIDVNACTDLEKLDCSNNRLNSYGALYADRCQKLEELYCNDNGLLYLYLYPESPLRILNAEGNDLQELDLSGQYQLEILYCGHNGFKSLELAENAPIRVFECEDNMWLEITTNGTYDLQLDPARIKKIKNASMAGTVIKANKMGQSFTYTLDCGNGHTATFTGVLDCAEGRWEKVGSKWRYVYADGGYARDREYLIGDNIYRFDKNGYMVTGWFTEVLYDHYGNVVRTDKCYYDGDGTPAEGWRSIRGKYYFFTSKLDLEYQSYVSGRMAIGLIEYFGDTFLLSNSGVRLSGWQTVDGEEYHFNEENGAMDKDCWVGEKHLGPDGRVDRFTFYPKWIQEGKRWWFRTENGEKAPEGWLDPPIDDSTDRYYIGSDGYRCEGWLEIPGDGTYYLDEKDGRRLTGITKIGKDTYYLDPNDGQLQTGTIYSYGGEIFVADEEGKLQSGWYDQTQGDSIYRYYLLENGKAVTGIRKIGKNSYFFDHNGKLFVHSSEMPVFRELGGNKYCVNQEGIILTGLQTVSDDEKEHFFLANGMMARGLQKIGRYTYYFDANGVKQYGPKSIDGAEYLFDLKDGRAVTGWQTQPDGSRKYYFADGKRAEGQQKIGSYNYLFGSDGIMLTGWQNNMYFDAKGRAVKGWKTIDGNQYYFKPDYTKAVGFTQIGRSLYYFGQDGLAEPGWQDLNDHRYYFDKSGKAYTGWKTVEKQKYYFDENGVLANGLTVLGKYTYYFDAEGHAAPGWQDLTGNRYYFDQSGRAYIGWKTIDGQKYYFGTDGVMYRGLQQIGKYNYYLDEDTGEMQTGEHQIQGVMHSFDKYGKAFNGFKKNTEGKTYYFDAEGTAVTGLYLAGKYYYYFDEAGVMQTGDVKIDQTIHSFGKNGRAVTGWFTAKDGQKHYRKADGSEAVSELVKIGSVYYSFGAQGLPQEGWAMDPESGKSFYCDPKGRAVTGWKIVDGMKHYFQKDGSMATGVVRIGRNYYRFDLDGITQPGFEEAELEGKPVRYFYDKSGCRVTGWQDISYCKYYFQKDGTAAIGNVKIGRYWYYFDESGEMRTGLCFESKDGCNVVYLMGLDGRAMTGWRTNLKLMDNTAEKCYVNPNGAIAEGLTKVGRYYYGFTYNFQMAKGYTYLPSEEDYYLFDDQGRMQTGWHDTNNNTFYFDANGKQHHGILEYKHDIYYLEYNGLVRNSSRVIDGVECYFNQDGKLVK